MNILDEIAEKNLHGLHELIDDRDISDFYMDVIKLCMVEFAKNILEEASVNATCSNKPRFLGDINYQVDEESIISVINKYE